jgi:mercuric ion transport protein
MNNSKLMSVGVFTAIAASLCCIVPVLTLIAGSGAIASSFSWIAPARPYMIGLTIALLGFAWYQKLKPQAADDCGCAVDEKPKFLQSKIFLLSITLFAALMIAFPFYSKAFFSKKEKTTILVEKSNIRTVELKIKGMSCEACEGEVNHEVNKLPGIVQSTVSYKNRNAVIQFDISKTTIKDITGAVNTTGYKVISQPLKN